jgi:hypothetical protein
LEGVRIEEGREIEVEVDLSVTDEEEDIVGRKSYGSDTI